FAAGETWQATSSLLPQNKIYYCEIGTNPLDLGLVWTELPVLLPLDLNVLTLVAAPAPPGSTDDFWLFAGTEDGIYFYQSRQASGTSSWDQKLPNERIFALAFREQPTRRLFVASNQGLLVLDSDHDDWAIDPAFNHDLPLETSLAVLVDPNSSDHVWVGTAFD